LLKEKIESQDFDYVIVKNSRFSVFEFETHSGTEHLLQGHNDEFTNDLFYQDKLNLFELYNSVVAVDGAAPHLQLGPTIDSLRTRYESVLAENENYLSLSQAKYEP